MISRFSFLKLSVQKKFFFLLIGSMKEYIDLYPILLINDLITEKFSLHFDLT
jgi:hypothetical protein